MYLDKNFAIHGNLDFYKLLVRFNIDFRLYLFEIISVKKCQYELDIDSVLLHAPQHIASNATHASLRL